MSNGKDYPKRFTISLKKVLCGIQVYSTLSFLICYKYFWIDLIECILPLLHFHWNQQIYLLVKQNGKSFRLWSEHCSFYVTIDWFTLFWYILMTGNPKWQSIKAAGTSKSRILTQEIIHPCPLVIITTVTTLFFLKIIWKVGLN